MTGGDGSGGIGVARLVPATSVPDADSFVIVRATVSCKAAVSPPIVGRVRSPDVLKSLRDLDEADFLPEG